MAAETSDESARWWQRIQSWEGAWKRESGWKREVLDSYANKFPSGLLTVNMMFSYGRSLIPQLYFKNPVVSINIPMPGFEDTARTIQLLDDALIRAMQAKQVLKRVILAAHLTGRGVAKMGYGVGAGTAPPLADLSNLGLQGSNPVWKTREMIAPNRPWMLDFNCDDFAYDHEAKRVRDSNWFAMRFTKKVYEVRDDETLLSATEGNLSEEDDEIVEFWEIWDKYSGQYWIQQDNRVAADSRQDIIYWPFLNLDFNETVDTPWPISDGNMMLAQQRELNEVRTQISEHRRISLLKIIARKGVFDPADKARLEQGVVGAIAETSADPATAIREFNPHIPVELYTEANTIREDIRDVEGFTRNQLGEFSQSRRTALEAQIVQQALQLRLDERRDMVADFLAAGITTANDMVFDRWTPREVELWAGQSTGWERVPEIRATYLVTVVPDSTLPLSRTLAKQEAQVLFGSLRQDPMIDPLALRKHYLSQFEGVDPTQLIMKPTGLPQVPVGGQPTQGGLQLLQGGRQ